MNDSFSFNVALYCPVCGHDKFEMATDDESGLVVHATCTQCGRGFNSDALKERNSDVIQASVEAHGPEIVEDLVRTARREKWFK